jgi:hypothetical protein
MRMKTKEKNECRRITMDGIENEEQGKKVLT